MAFKERLENAMERESQRRGKRVAKLEVARALYPQTTADPHGLLTNLANIMNGRTTKFSAEGIKNLCKLLGCSADYLLGISNHYNYESTDFIKQKVGKIATELTDLCNAI